MKKIKEIIVVEGKDDTKKIALAVEADTIETNGSAINEDILKQIELAYESRGVIVFTDPDGPGEKIRKIISMEVPGVKHAFLSRDEARYRGKTKESIGIEHASIEAIREALEKVVEERILVTPTVSREFLYSEGLIGTSDARETREALGDRLRIGYTNAKQLEKRLNMFGITEEEVKKALDHIREDKKYDRT